MVEKNFFDFKSEEKFDLNEQYSNLFGEEGYKQTNPNESKLKDAENIIEESIRYVEFTSLERYEKSFLNLNEFLVKFRTDSEEVKNMTEEERSKLFGYGKELFTYYQNQYSSLNFNFELSIKEWNFIDHTLTKKLLYNGQELFNYWELFTKFIEPTRKTVSSLPKGTESFVALCSIQNLILLSHLLMKHEEKGSTDSFYYFKNVLGEIAKMTKLFNAYGVMLERITNRFNHWVNAINAIDGYNNDNRMDESEQQPQE